MRNTLFNIAFPGRLRLALLLAVCIGARGIAAAETIAVFNQINFEGWTYTRGTVELNASNISRGKVTLYHSGDNHYTLLSPMLDNAGGAFIIVAVEAESHNYDQTAYDPAAGSPTAELLDTAGTVVATATHTFTTREYVRNFEMSLAAPSNAGPLRLRLAAWDATVTSALAVKSVTVTAEKAAHGDVNGDGEVTVGDVSAIYDVMLGVSLAYKAGADINGDGEVTVADVTEIYNIILGAQ